MTRNRFAGEPFDDGDGAIAEALADVSVPALLCSLVHMTGDPSWVRGDIQPNVGMSLDIQGGMSEEDMAEVRRRALPAIAAYRDGGCVPVELSRDLLLEMMGFLGRRPVEGPLAGLLFDDLQFEGGDSGADLVGRRGLRGPEGRGHRSSSSAAAWAGSWPASASSRPVCPSPSSTRTAGPGGTWWENRYPGARVDVGSHQYCFSFEPAELWSEYYCQQPELLRLLRRHRRQVRSPAPLPLRHVRDRVGLERGRGHVARAACATRSAQRACSQARFVISAVGSLNLPRLPDIPGMDTFAGPSFHSARWPEDLDIRGHPVRARRRRRQRVPDRSRHRGRGRAAHHLPAHGAVDPAQPALPHARAGGGRLASTE